MFDITGVTFIKVVSHYYRSSDLFIAPSLQAAGVQSPLTGAWVPGDDDDRETQETVRKISPKKYPQNIS